MKIEEVKEKLEKKEEKHFMLFRDEVFRYPAVMFLVFAALCFLAAFLQLPVHPPFDPFKMPPTNYPDWYFFPVFGFLKSWTWPIGPIPAKLIGGIIGPSIFVLLLFILPFIDRKEAYYPWDRPFWTIVGVITIIAMVALSIFAVVHH